MKKKKKGKVRWLSVLLAGCLLLSIIPATAFAAEDTAPTKSENAVEETQMPEQQKATEESTTENGTTEETKMEAVTPAPKDETKAADNGVSGTSMESKNDKAEEPQPSEQPDTEAESKISEQPDAEKKSTTENALPAGRGVTDVSGGQGVEVKTTVRNNYTDTRTEETVTYANGIALVDGDQSALNGSVLTFTGLGDRTIQAVYDSAGNKTTLTLDISNIQRQTEEKQYFTEYKENKSRMTTTYDGSKLSYTDSITDSVTGTGKVIINEIRDDYYTRNHVYERACLIIPAAESESESISFANVQNTNFNWQLDTAPQATAEVPDYDTDKYEIAYECWQEFENNEPVAAWYSDNGSHGSLPAITKFESGKEYVYSLMLKPKDGYSFSDETVVTVNGETVKSSLSGEFLYVPAVKTITMPAIKVIDVVEVNDVTVSFKDGDKPVFTGKTPDGVNYHYDCEWWELDSKTGAISSEFFSSAYENKITAFETGKTYHYGVYVKAVGWVESENTTYVFGPNTKLKINGEFVNYKRYEGDESDGSDSTMWVLTDLTMTPEAGGTTPSEKYTVTYTDGVDGEEIFEDQTYTIESGKATPAFNGTPVRDGYKFVGWSPAVTDTVTGNVTYTAQWEKVATPAETFTVTYTDGVDNEEIFKAQTYTVESGKATPAFNGTPTRKGYTFAGWKPAVAATVTGNATYEATWKSNSATTTPKDDKSNTGETTSPKPGDTGNGKNTTTLAENKSDTVTNPQTGDTSNMLLWFALLFVSCGALVGTVVIGKKKKTMK